MRVSGASIAGLLKGARSEVGLYVYGKLQVYSNSEAAVARVERKPPRLAPASGATAPVRTSGLAFSSVLHAGVPGAVAGGVVPLGAKPVNDRPSIGRPCGGQRNGTRGTSNPRQALVGLMRGGETRGIGSPAFAAAVPRPPITNPAEALLQPSLRWPADETGHEERLRVRLVRLMMSRSLQGSRGGHVAQGK
jgi:hypothetical protein